ncbi:adenylate/guanylate cyclase domain-containing protein [Phenylobacterium sp.]|uniref:adenylate/guanylate cyclase domain-containing protein n=1 Tax=Phenylobacterium sp. TaxID=1871053 RepID=UPI0025F5AA27|nr:adenylate/guanylate cyclase domain-containing protein [Phenylobacterium sp.]
MTSLEAASPNATPAAARSAVRRFIFAAVLLMLLGLLCAPFFIDPVEHHPPQARAGVVSYAGWGPLTRPVELKGEWRMVWLTAPAPGAVLPIRVPGEWEGPHPGGPTLPIGGAAQYHLLMRGLPAGQYTLYVRQSFSACSVFVNGRLMSQRGRVGLTPGTSQPLYRSQQVTFDADGSDVDLRIDLSSFHHHDTGIRDVPIFGLSAAMNDWITLDWLQSLMLITSLLLIASYSVVVFLFRPRERASLYFGAACLLLLPFAAFVTHDNMVKVALPALGFNAMLMGQYLATTAALSCVIAYVRELYPRETPRWPYWVLQGLNAARFILYAGVGMTGDTVLLSTLSGMASSFRTLSFVLMLAVIVTACVRRRDGALLFLFGLGSFVLALVYTDTVNNLHLPAVLGVNLVPVGSLLMLFSQLLILAERWSTAIDTSEQTNMDLRRLLDVNISISSEMRLEALLKKIVAVTTTLIHADRSSLFLYDERTDELASVVAEGVAGGEIRFPATAGLAGWCLTNGEAVNLPDAYADPRFNRDVDATTGYRTRSVLTVPITTRDGRRVGVMQALNHEDMTNFGDSDVERMSAFAAQAAIAIENATLFTEVAAERNYNESILRSMSSGVITLNREAKVAKLNAAACAILGVSAEQAGGADAHLLLSGRNSWLMEEIEAVSASGRPKTLLDADVITPGGDTVSANLSIVPLVGETEQAGLLIIVDDISEGKRLQGAMRRFMTQNVVDQIMGREDELLFGAACQASVLFADIRGFTSLAEHLGPRDTVDMLNEIFTDLFEAVAACDGMLDKFIGDAIMAVYGAPLSSGRDALNAVDSAVTMVAMVVAINARRRGRGLPDVGLGLGIASGEVVAGTIGSPKRMDYTVIGDSVNLASRLEAITKVYKVGIVICEDTAAAVGTAHPMRELDTIRVRGRQRPERIFQVLTDSVPIAAAALDAYARGREALAERRWADAIAAFEAALAAAPADHPCALMLDRARILARRPPAANWDGVWDGLEPMGAVDEAASV